MTAARRNRDKVRRHRHRLRMREQGLRLVQFWVPDTRSTAFVEAARRQSATVAASERAKEDQAFVDAISTEWP